MTTLDLGVEERDEKRGNSGGWIREKRVEGRSTELRKPQQ